MSSSSIRILLVDDDEDDFLIVKDLLAEEMQPRPELRWVADADEAAQEMETDNYDVFLVDYRLGRDSGLELLERFDLSQRREPFIILTGLGDESVEREAMKIGAADYLVKGKFGAELLRRVIEYSLQRKRMETQRIEHLLELNRSKDEFIAIASHQLRTPASAVKQYLGVLLGGFAGDVSEKQESLLQRAYATNERQLKIVDDILRTARLDLHQVELQHETLHVRTLLDDCIQDIHPILESRNQTIDVALPAASLEVVGDPAFLRMAIGNILDNASKYSSQGTAIGVTAKQVGATVAIAISDHGVGIAAQDMSKLFNKFSRIANPLSEDVGGTGLGLYWAKTIVALHGGGILPSSTLGKGTTFTITLPLAKSA